MQREEERQRAESDRLQREREEAAHGEPWGIGAQKELNFNKVKEYTRKVLCVTLHFGQQRLY